ncbi:MAG: TonB family protein [Acidobacteriota bacterium]
MPEKLSPEAQEFPWIVDESPSRLRWALAAAVVAHAVFLLIPFPEAGAQATPEAENPRVFVVQQVRFKPPVIEPVPEIPKRRARRVPVPDPTPNDPEPLRTLDEIEPALDLPETDLVLDVPTAPPPIEPVGVLRIGGEIRRPAKIFAPDPIYPEIARRVRYQGVVVLRTTLDRTGRVRDVTVLKDLPFGLDAAAAEAVSRWRYEPATLRGKPVEVEMEVTVRFSLQ